jgi:hypothetical protein
MGHLILIGAFLGVGLVALWYFLLARYNRRKGARALRWVEAACSGKGRILEARWFGSSRLQARLVFAAAWLDNARITVCLLPRAIPFQWLLSIWRKQQETLTFESDLDYVPGFDLEVYRHRWFAHQHHAMKTTRKWFVSRPGPVVLTTHAQWNQELTPVVNTLMMSRGQNLVSLRLHSQSPQLSATVTLNSLSGKEETAHFLNMIHDLATGASTSRP